IRQFPAPSTGCYRCRHNDTLQAKNRFEIPSFRAVETPEGKRIGSGTAKMGCAHSEKSVTFDFGMAEGNRLLEEEQSCARRGPARRDSGQIRISAYSAPGAMLIDFG